MSRTTRTVSTRPANQGSNWIRRAKRVAIYAADGHTCTYCGAAVSVGDERGQARPGFALATLDHIEPVGIGSNAAENLTTACATCNNAKGDDDLAWFLARHNRTLLAILASAEVSA